MRKLWLALLILPFLASAQTQRFIGNPIAGPISAPVLSTDTIPIIRGGVLYNATVAQIELFSLIGTGTLLNGVLTVGPGSSMGTSGNGGIMATGANGLAFPQSCFLATTNSSGQFTCVSASPTGCINITSAQIFSSCTQPAASTFALLPTCNAAANGTIVTQTDVTSYPPARGGTASGGGSSSWNVECSSNVGVYNWVYL